MVTESGAETRSTSDVGTAVSTRSDRSPWRSRARTSVHAGLLVSALGALGTLDLLHIRIAFHTDVGLAFVALVLVHLFQRRHTLARWAVQLVRARRRAGKFSRLVSADALLAFLTLNVLASGILDWNRGSPELLPFVPGNLARWHLLSSLLLVVDLVVHVSRRRRRLRRSTIQ